VKILVWECALVVGDVSCKFCTIIHCPAIYCTLNRAVLILTTIVSCITTPLLTLSLIIFDVLLLWLVSSLDFGIIKTSSFLSMSSKASISLYLGWRAVIYPSNLALHGSSRDHSSIESISIPASFWKKGKALSKQLIDSVICQMIHS
jgi:hypothetical protein